MTGIRNKKILLLGTGIVISGLIILTTVHFSFQESDPVLEMPVYTPRLIPDSLYGLQKNKFKIETRRIKSNQTFAGIFQQLGINKSESRILLNRVGSLININSLKKGDPYTIFVSAKDQRSLQCLVYEPDPTHYILFDLRDSLIIKRIDRKVEKKTLVIYADIKSSLYQTMVHHNINPNMIMKMAEIFSSTIDFFRIQKGDYFKMILEDEFVDNSALGTGKIKAVCFNHEGKDFYAFHFSNGKISGYFDEKSNGMRKQFLKAPLKFSTITSKFSKQRFHPVLKVNKPHLGTDYAAPRGTPVLAVGNGTILESKYSMYNGNYVKIKHNQTYTTQYLHLSKIHKGIKPGVHVKQGEVIGYVGSTGLATGPHVCFRFWKNGVQSDPLKEKNQFSEPLNQQYFAEFKRIKDELKNTLSNLKI